MRVGILYYSGAGNTEAIAERLGQILGAQSEIQIAFLERIHADADYAALRERYDVLCVGFPVYFGRAPALVEASLREIAVGGRRIVGFCTYSVSPAAAVSRFRRLAGDMGMVVGAWVQIRMPPTHMLLFTPRHSRRAHWLQGWFDPIETEVKLARLAGSLDWSSGSSAGGGGRARAPAASAISQLHVWNLRRHAGGLQVLAGRCTQCGICAQGCPAANIRLVSGYPNFGDRCALCLGCIHRCPTEAIQMGGRTINTVRYLPVWSPEGELVNARS